MKYRNIKTFLVTASFGALLMVSAAGVANAQERWRITHGGSRYETDNRGAELLRNAVREGYREGFRAGVEDRNSRRRNNWRANEVYRDGLRGYDQYVERSQYQYYFQQGFQKGYDDGFRRRTRYGNNESILGAVLDTIFRPRRY